MSEFSDWKTHPVTKVVFEALQLREKELTESLVSSAGTDSLEDRYKAGYIAALRDVYLITVEDVQEAK